MSTIPAAMLRQSADLPYISLTSELPFIDKGSFKLQLLQVSIESGLWVIRTLFAPGTTSRSISTQVKYLHLLVQAPGIT